MLLKKGTRLDAAALGVLASAGLTEVEVCRRPRVGLLTTGDEVVESGSPRPAGKIYGANQLLLAARLAELGFEFRATHRGDDPAAVAEVMGELLAGCDLLITTGGVSVGDKDIFHQALPLLGAEQVFWRVDLKPGTPAMYSVYQDKPILSLSGNPFAAFTTFELLARPLLAVLSGEPGPRWGEGVLDTPFPKASPKRRFIRGRYENGHITLAGGTLLRAALLPGGVQLSGRAAGGLAPAGGRHAGTNPAAVIRRLLWNLCSIISTRRVTPLWWM